MAYLSSTTTSPNVPAVTNQSIAGPRQWVYKSTHTAAEAEVVNFFTDGVDLGFKAGDYFLVLGSTTYAASAHTIAAVGSTINNISSGVTLSDGST